MSAKFLVFKIDIVNYFPYWDQGRIIEALSAFQEAQRMSLGVKETYNNIGSRKTGGIVF